MPTKKTKTRQRFHTLDDFMASLPEKRRQKIESKAKKKINAIRLQLLREKLHVTQEDLAERLGMKQSSLSKLEHRENVTLKTLTDYVSALGGRVRVLAVFDEKKPVELLD
jgi:DNA-binding transcriptional regulator YiaG